MCIRQHVHIPTFVLLGVCIFCYSTLYQDITNAIQFVWVLLSVCIMLIWSAISSLRGRNRHLIQKNNILFTFCVLGIIEVIYSLLQICCVLPHNFRYGHFAGSLGNPAIFGMLMSFCSLVSYYFTICSSGPTRRNWCILTIFYVLFIVLSNSRTAMIASFGAITVIGLIETKLIKHVSPKKSILLGFILFITFTCLYLYKKDSADGRILIWSICIDMIKEKPFLGWGTDGFISQYMFRQAQYFSEHPDSRFTQIADVVNIPFNEYLNIAIMFGVLPVALLFVIIIIALNYICKNKIENKSLLIGIITCLMIWSLFSYPLHIPFIWFIIAYITICIVYSGTAIHKTVNVIILICSFIISTITIKFFYREFQRLYIQKIALKQGIRIDVFEQSYNDLCSDGLFLYSYGAALHNIGEYEKSIKILNECSKHIADYNVQLLLGDNYQQLGMSDSAIARYDMASKMIPNRFLPLYYQMRLYKDIGQNNKAKKMAQNILSKKIKVDNTATREIIREARECLSIK